MHRDLLEPLTLAHRFIRNEQLGDRRVASGARRLRERVVRDLADRLRTERPPVAFEEQHVLGDEPHDRLTPVLVVLRGPSAGTREAESVYSALTGPEPPSTAASSSVARSSGVSVSRRAATRPRMLSGRSGSASAGSAVSHTSDASSSRKNGLPPLRSRSWAAMLGQSRLGDATSTSCRAAARSSGSRLSTASCGVPGRPPVRSPGPAACSGDEHERKRPERGSKRSTSSSTTSSAQCRSERTTTRRAARAGPRGTPCTARAPPRHGRSPGRSSSAVAEPAE